MVKASHRLDLPDELSQIHKTFHASQLWKCVADDFAVIPLDDIQVDERMNYVERAIMILGK